MRDRKFRSYYQKITNNKWVIEGEYTFKELTDRGIQFDQIRIKWAEWTGLKDRNLVDIYEGDILSYSEHYYGDFRYSSGRGVVEFYNGEFIISETELSPKLCEEEIYNESMEIIGNIYEHKHLLK